MRRVIFYSACFLGFLNGRRGRTIYEQNSGSDHLAVFINHFLAKPSENAGLLKHLFIEKSWSALQISRFTGWPKTSVIDAIRLHDLSREPKARLKARYGWKVEGDELMSHVRQQLVIAKMKKWREDGMALNAIAKRLNETGVASPQGKSWDHKTVQGILHRESASESMDAVASPAPAETEQVNPATEESV